MRMIVVRPHLIDVYINGRDRKPPMLGDTAPLLEIAHL